MLNFQRGDYYKTYLLLQVKVNYFFNIRKFCFNFDVTMRFMCLKWSYVKFY